MFNKIATFANGVFAAIKAFGIQLIAIPSSFVQHISAMIHDTIVGVSNHVIAVVRAVHSFVASVTNHLTLLVTPAPKAVVAPVQTPAAVTKQSTEKTA